MHRQMRDFDREAYPGVEQDILAARPPCDSAMGMVIDCIRAVEGDRHLGYGAAGPIPFTAIDAWARRNSIDGRMFHVLLAVVQRHDGERLAREASERALKR